jgi:non-ribosomal peptide synthetase component F/NADP-dependent 3-hydroxy acid dehydrogenase YdfG
MNDKNAVSASAQARRAQFLQKLKKAPAEPMDGPVARARDPQGEPLSDGQQRMWFFAQLDSESTAYNMPVALRLRGELDVAAMTAALRALCERHEILRTVFFERDGEPRQRAREDWSLAVDYVEVADGAGLLDAELRDKSVLTTSALPAPVQGFADDRFDLAESAFRAAIFRLGENDHLLMLVLHHLIGDGWSLGVIERELDALYAAFRRAEPSPLAPLTLQYIDYAHWRRDAVNAVRRQQQCEFWRAELADVPPTLDWPSDRPRPLAPSHAGESLPFQVPSALAQRLAQWAQRRNTSLYSVLLAVFDVFVARYCQIDDIIIGTPVANRQRSALEGMIGFFANTVALRMRIDDAETLGELVDRCKHTIAQAFSNQEVPFDQVVEYLGLARSTSAPPLVQTLFVLQSGPFEVLAGSGLKVDRVGLGRNSVEFDLIVEMLQTGDGIEGIATYSTELFDRATMAHMLELYIDLLHRALDHNDRPLADLRLSSPIADDALSSQRSASNAHAANPHWLVRIRDRSHSMPDAIAFETERGSLRYGELWCGALAAADAIRSETGSARPRVGLLCQDLETFAIAALATALAGGEWVDLDLQCTTSDWLATWARYTPDLIIGPEYGALPFVSRRMSSARLIEFARSCTAHSGDAVVPTDDVCVYRRFESGREYAVRTSALNACVSVLDAEYPQLPQHPGARVWMPHDTYEAHRSRRVLWCLAAGACIADRPIVDPLFVLGATEPTSQPASAAAFVLTIAADRALPALSRAMATGAALGTVLWHGQPLDADLRAQLSQRADALHHVHELPWIEGPVAVSTDASDIDASNIVKLAVDAYALDPRTTDRLYLEVTPGAYAAVYLPAERHVVSVESLGNDTCPDAADAYDTPEHGVPEHGVHEYDARAHALRDTRLRLRLRRDGYADRLQWPRECQRIGQRRYDLPAIERRIAALDRVTACRVLTRDDSDGRTWLLACVAADTDIALSQIVAAVSDVVPDAGECLAYVVLPALPKTSSGRLDEALLSQMPAVDAALETACRRILLDDPAVRDAAVMSRWAVPAPSHVHLADAVPGWSRHRAVPTAAAESDRLQADDTDASCVAALSLSEGEPLTAEDLADGNLAGVLARVAAMQVQRVLHYIDSRGEAETHSYAELADEAARILGGLRARGLQPGDRVFLQLPRNRDIVPAFWACVLGGFVAVPLGCASQYHTDNAENAKFANAWRMLGASCTLCVQALREPLDGFASRHDLDGFVAYSIEELRAHAPDLTPYPAPADALALMLLTSGSTGVPKAVTQTHGALIARSAATRRMNGFTPEDVSLNWMPLDHVGGLVMFHLMDLFVGCDQLQVDTGWILQDPLRWLDLIDRYRVSITWAPNFAYALVCDEVDRHPGRRWELSSLQFILNGGEAVVAASARRFLYTLAAHGLPGTAMKPAWGMSETCSGVTFHRHFDLATSADSDAFTLVGQPVPGFAVRIVDADNRLVPEGRSGRLQVKGPSVTRGYFNNPAVNAESFTEDGWFCTGDLGVLRAGNLTITGREKDLIIINGANYYGHELEKAVDDSGFAQTSFTAACPVRLAGENTDRLAVFFCPNCGPERWPEALSEIRMQLLKTCGVSPDYLVPVTREDIPKTSIGKIQRGQLATRLMQGEFDANLKRVDLLLANENTLPMWFYDPQWRAMPAATSMAALRGACVMIVADEARSAGAERIALRLREAGADVVRLVSDNRFAIEHERRVRIDLQSADDWSRAFDALRESGLTPSHLLYLNRQDGDGRPQAGNANAHGAQSQQNVASDLDGDAVLAFQTMQVYPLVALAQAMKRQPADFAKLAVRILADRVFAVRTQDAPQPAKATLAGLVRTANHELPRSRWRLVDTGDFSPTQSTSEFERRVLAELADTSAEPVVAYRRRSRFVPRLAAAPVGQDARMGRRPAAPSVSAAALSADGRYLITGGLGGIGRRVCHALLALGDVRLLILGRTPLEAIEIEPGPDAAEQRNLLALCREDGRVRYRTVDLLDAAALEACVRDTERAWGAAFSGALHLAGAFAERRLDAETPGSWRDLLAPKVLGACHLHRALAHVPDALFVHFSSVNGHFGGTGVGAYAAASAFLDQFCAWQNARGRRSYSLGFSMWDELGMSRGYAMKELTRRHGFHTMAPEQGVHSLLAALQLSPGHHLIGLDGGNRQILAHCEPATMVKPALIAFVECDDESSASRPVEGRSFAGAFAPALACEAVATPELARDEASGGIDWPRLVQISASAGISKRDLGQDWQSDLERELAEIWREVLGGRRVARTDNFFESGGNSLLVGQVISRIRNHWSVELGIRELFEAPTVAQLAARVEAAKVEDAHNAANGHRPAMPLQAMSREGGVPLALAQQRLWVLDRLEGPSATYNMPSALRLKGTLDVPALERSFAELQRRHEALRTYFAEVGDQVMQVIEPERIAPVLHIDLSAVPAPEREARMMQIAKEDAARPFVLTAEPAFRVTLVRLSDDDHVLLTAMHHIISDGWSIGVMVREFMRHYQAYRDGREPQIAPLAVQYPDFTLWQRQWLTPEAQQRQLQFWRDTLQGLPPLLPLPTDYPRPAVQSYRGDALTAHVPPATMRALEALAAREGCSLYMVLLAAFQWLLARYSGQTDIAVGASVANRNRAELEELIGFFANTVVMRTKIQPQLRFLDLLATVKANALAAYAHQDVPFDQVVEAVQPERSIAHSPLFQVLFVTLDTPIDALQLPGLELTPVDAGMAATHFDLSVHVHHTERGAECHFMYNTDLFAATTIERMLAHWQRLVADIAANPQRALSHLDFLDSNERTFTQPPVPFAADARHRQRPACRVVLAAFGRSGGGDPGDLENRRGLSGVGPGLPGSPLARHAALIQPRRSAVPGRRAQRDGRRYAPRYAVGRSDGDPRFGRLACAFARQRC